jgi:hypothetical protein
MGDTMRTIKFIKDFGAEGVPASSVDINYRDNYSPVFPDELRKIVETAWQESLQKNPKAENRDLLNLVSINELPDITVLSVGSIPWAYYNETRQLLDGAKKPENYALSQELLNNLEQKVHVLSNFPAFISGDYFIMGKKSGFVSAPGAGKISFPGAGYTDKEKDVYTLENTPKARPLIQIVKREIKEETNLNENEMQYVSVLGIAEDTFKGSHRNPGIMSVVYTALSPNDFNQRKQMAQDAWEHEGPYIFVPKNDPELLKALIESDVNVFGKPIDEKYAQLIKGLGDKRTIDTTGKSQFMLYLLGRHLFGDDWYKRTLDEHSSKLSVR